MRYYSSNAGAMQLQAPVNPSSTALVVDSVSGIPISTPFTVVLSPGSDAEEVATVTAVVGTTLTVVRGEDGTVAMSHGAGAEVRHMVTARDFREPQQHIEATSGVHGVVGPLAQLLPTGVTLPFAGVAPPSGFHLADGSSKLRAEDPDLFAVIGTTWGEGDDPGNTFALPNLVDRTAVGAGGDHSLGDTFGEAEVTLGVNHMPSHSHAGTAASGGAHSHTGSTGSGGSHSHSVTHNAVNWEHRHAFDNAYALISPTAAGNMYFVPRNGLSFSAGGRIDGDYGGQTSNRSNWVRVEGSTGNTKSISGSWNDNASISIGSGGSHSHSVTTSSDGAHTHAVSTNAQGGGEAHNNMQPSAALYWIIKR